jgi:hypothetical protein
MDILEELTVPSSGSMRGKQAFNKLCMCLVPACHMSHFSALKMEAALYSTRSMIYQTARRHIPEENNLKKSECLQDLVEIYHTEYDQNRSRTLDTAA